MSGPSQPEKVFSHEVLVPASQDDVWRAISEGSELARWFPIAARVKPGLGGSVFLSWGPMCEGEAPIVIWEPGKRLGWQESHDGGAVQIAAMFEIRRDEASGGTFVKVVQSGFGVGAKWEDMYDSISNGWKFELKSLVHYLRRHKGENRAACWMPVLCELSIAEAWKRLCAPSPSGLLKNGSLEGWLEGDPYTFVGPDGREYRGIVERCVSNKTFAGTVEWLDDALLRVEIERTGGKCMPCVWLSVWGPKSGQAQGIAESWRDGVSRVVG